MAVIDDVYVMPHLAAIWVSGLDAEKFLQSQLSSNIAALEPGAKQFASWCAANGRVIGLGWLFRTQMSYCWIVAANTARALTVGLNNYRLRSKVDITQAEAHIAVIGSQHALNAGITSVQLDDGRALGIGSINEFKFAPEHFFAHWQTRDIELKIPWNGGGERFLPQMLGIERFAGLSLKKGCFPGQEVISRLHYKGVLKRNLRVLQFDQPIIPGRFLCHELSEEIEIIQAQGVLALAVVANNLLPEFSIQRDGLAVFCRSAEDEFLRPSENNQIQLAVPQ